MSDAIRLFIFPAMMAFAASSDLFTMTISNRVSLILLAGFFLAAWLIGMPPQAMAWHVAAGATVLCAGFVLFAFNYIGGGDAKLAASIALWLGFDQLLDYLLWASIFGGVLTFLIIRFRFIPLPAWAAKHAWIRRLHRMDTGIPYGVALAAAALMIYPHTLWMTAQVR